MGLMLKVLVGIWVGSQIIDGLMTWYFVSQGVVGEANPLLASLASSLAFPVLKLVGALVFGVMLYLAAARLGRIGAISAGLLAGVGIGIVVHNLSMLAT